jgi:hypothetical protein
MNESDRGRLSLLLRGALPPAGGADPPPDLWPRMLRRLDQHPAPWGWLDLACASLAGAGLCVFPEAIPWILYCM